MSGRIDCATPQGIEAAQDRLLETALDLYRMIQRLHRCREGLGIPSAIAREYYEAEGRTDEPPTIELAVAEEIHAAIGELQGIARGLQQAACLTDAGIRKEWREERQAAGVVSGAEVRRSAG